MNSTPTLCLASLVAEACQYPVGSRQRQRLVTQIIRQMQQSGKIWRDYRIDADQYQEALQRTWVWFCQNLHNYDATQSSLMTWFNGTLQYRIKDVKREAQIQQQQFAVPYDETIDLISNLPAPPTDEPLQWLTETLDWLQQEQPRLQQITIRDRPDLDAYTLIQRRLPTPHQASWKVLSAQFDISIPTLSSFYRRQCLPLLREFAQAQGWMENAAPSRKTSSPKSPSMSPGMPSLMANLNAYAVTQAMRSA